MDIKIYRTAIFSDAKQELIATAVDLRTAAIICSALAMQGIGYWAEDKEGKRVFDD